MIALRPYQLDALAAVEGSGKRAQMVALPTGTGKTVVFSEMIRRRGGTALILAHRDELLGQAHAKLTTVAPELGLSVGYVQADRDDHSSPIVIGSVQTLARQKRLERLPKRFDTVIVDEAHHATADSYRRILDYLEESPLVVGFTATPERADKSKLADVFEEISYARSIEEMIREGWLSNLRGIRVTLEDLDLAKVKRSGGDYKAGELGEALENADAIEHCVGAYLEHAAERKCVAFFPTVETSKHAEAAFCAAGVAAAHVDGETPKHERRRILAAYAGADRGVICNVGVLTEGFDDPATDCILIASPTRSRVKYAQMVGRGTRTFPGKQDCLVLDLVGVTDTLSIQTIGVLFGLREQPAPEETVTDAQEREEREDIEAAATAEAKRDRRREYDRKRRRAKDADLFNRDRIHWLHVGDRWILSLKKDLVVLDSAGGGPTDWRVLIVRERGATIVARNFDLGYAQGVAEQLARDANAISLADTEAAWRLADATPGQLGMLKRLGVDLDEGVALTKGEASDFITTAIATERLEKLDRALARMAA